MFPQLVSEKIHFYFWKYNINICNKQFHEKIIIYDDNTEFKISVYDRNSYKSYNYRDLHLIKFGYFFLIHNKRDNVVSYLHRNY